MTFPTLRLSYQRMPVLSPFPIAAKKKGGVSLFDLMNVADTGYFDWLGYQPKKEQFVLIVEPFIRECNKISNHSFSFDDLMTELDITDYQIDRIKIKGKKHQATVINMPDLVHKILNINALIGDRDIDEEDILHPPWEVETVRE